MDFQQFLLAFLSAGLLFFALYYLFAVIVIHRKIFDVYFYFFGVCFGGAFYAFFQLLLSLPFTDQQYLLFHKLKISSLFIVIPFMEYTLYECYFDAGKKYIPNFMIVLSVLTIFTIPFDIFISLPISKIVINTPLSAFIYHGGVKGLTYSIYLNLMTLSVFVSIFYYLFSKSKTKKKSFVIIFLCFGLGAVNDLLVARALLNNIMLSEIVVFIFIAFIFYDLLKADRTTYLSVVDLSNELLKHKEELEHKVEERTRQLNERNQELLVLSESLAVKNTQVEAEKQKSDNLLLNVLPEPIAIRLKEGETQIADHFDEASVIFIDIADFTKLSAKSTPQKMVKMLNEVFTIFDKVSARYGIEKIKTIGDCYMAAAGIPVPRADHAEAISKMALDAMEEMRSYRTEDGHSIQFRIGLDCGPIVAGVIGEQKFIYDLWGDMVNTASRLETNGIIGKIQCTERFKDTLGNINGFKFEERGEIEIKGKGMMKTYFLNEKM